MKSIALLLAAAALTISGCTGYQPSKANCFNFVAGSAADEDCTFTQLGGPILAFRSVSGTGPSDAVYD